MRRISRSPRFSVVKLFLPITWAAFSALSQMQAQVMSGGGFQPAGSPDSPHYTLSGTVINSVTGEPISRALVQLSIAQRAILTDHEGHFQFDGLPATRAAFLQPVRKPGFFNEQQLGRHQMIPLVLGPDTAPVFIKLVPEAVIAGRVTDSNREPLEGVPVKVISWTIQNGRKQKRQYPPTRTNEDGEFRIANLQPGSYHLIAGPTRSGNLVGFEPAPSDLAYPAAYYPGVSEASASGEIRVTAGEHAVAEMALKSATAFSVSGTVTGYSMPPRLEFVNRSGEGTATAMRFDPATGKFDAQVIAGYCILKAHSQDARNASLYAEMPLNVERGIAGIRLSMVENGIPVIVQTQKTKTDSDGSNPRGGVGSVSSSQFARYSDARMNVPAAVTVISTDPAHPDARASAEGPDSNQLIVRGLENGRYRVEVMPFNSWYVQSATHGTSDLLSEDLVVLPGESRPISVVLRDDFATLTGSVQGLSDPESRAQVLIVPDRSPSNAKLASVSGRGESGLGVFAPGDYQVFAFDSVDGLEYTNPEVLREYSARGAHVTLQANQKSSVTVDLIRRAE